MTATPYGVTHRRRSPMQRNMEEELEAWSRRACAPCTSGACASCRAATTVSPGRVHGENANDLQYLVKYAGMTPMEVMLSATRLGGEIMMQGDELGPAQGGFPRRPAPCRRRSARRSLDPARSPQAARHHEGRCVPQGAGDAVEPHPLEPARRMSSDAPFWTGSGWRSIGVPIAAFVVWALADNPKQFVSTLLNGVTLAALYFLVASGFTLVFGLMRNVNLAHGSLYPARCLCRLGGRRRHRFRGCSRWPPDSRRPRWSAYSCSRSRCSASCRVRNCARRW